MIFQTVVQNIPRQDELPSICYMEYLGWDLPGIKYPWSLTLFLLSPAATELSPGFAGGMGLAHMRPALQTQEGLGENNKGFLSFYFQPETFTFSNTHCCLQRASLVIWWAMGQGLLCTGPQLGAGKGSLPKPMAIRGSEWKNQELAELLQSIFSFVFIFISEIGSQWDVQQQWRTSETGTWTGQDTELLRLTEAHIFTSRDSSEPDSANHTAMQDSSF